ncbi:MAG: hypothetical protein D3924_10875 [Candidatus Electrothrix sp. AR4]|nr:hypothetical protein [Candidatus Electrothrix sp. AR4]
MGKKGKLFRHIFSEEFPFFLFLSEFHVHPYNSIFYGILTCRHSCPIVFKVHDRKGMGKNFTKCYSFICCFSILKGHLRQGCLSKTKQFFLVDEKQVS